MDRQDLMQHDLALMQSDKKEILLTMHPDLRELPVLDEIYILGIAIHTLSSKEINPMDAKTASRRLIKLFH